MFNFSEQLRDECIEYFIEVHDENISHEEADRYLNSFADLFDLLSLNE